jgi:cation transport ATPase
MGIAIPLARMAGITLASKDGILVRNFSAFERAKKINAFVFDKTGTMTVGRWALIGIRTTGPFTEKQVLEMAAGLENSSEHYIASEIRNRANRLNINPANITRIRFHDNGISGYFEKRPIKIGSSDFLAKEIDACRFDTTLERAAFDEAHSHVYLGIGGQLIAVFTFGDRIKENSVAAAETLKEMGCRMLLVSGDGDRTTRLIGRKLGITDTRGGLLPQDKSRIIQKLQQAGYTVAMVGDGINDAPALATSDLAIAVHAEYNLSKETSDITLMRGDPGQITGWFGLARRVHRTIHQNLLFSLVYNTISIPVAMSGLLTPLIAVTAMLLSSLSVIGNTMRLIRKQQKAN